MLQLRDLPPTTQQHNPDNHHSNQDNAEGNSKNRTVRALRDCTIQAIKVPVGSAVTSPLKNCREVATKLALSSLKFGSGSSRTLSPQAGGDQQRHEANSSSATGYSWLATQHKRTFWLLTYIALVTTCPWIGSFFFFWWRRKATSTGFRLTK